MKITWFDASERTGGASIYESNITLNTIASVPLSNAYRVMVGVNEDGNIAISPLSKDRVIRGDLDEYSLYPISIKKSYSRICSSSLCRRIAEIDKLSLSKSPLHFTTEWNEEDNVLLILTSKKEGR